MDAGMCNVSRYNAHMGRLLYRSRCFEEARLQERRWIGDEEARRLRNELLAEAVPVRRADPRSVDVGGLVVEVPFIQLDAASRPEVDDLFRVVAAEGSQPRMASVFRYLMLGGQGYMEINVTLADPVSCRFKFVLQWPAQRRIFELMLMHGQLFFSTRDLNARQETSTLGLQIPRAELQPVIDLWRSRLDAAQADDDASGH